jgi:hypothetical protein
MTLRLLALTTLRPPTIASSMAAHNPAPRAGAPLTRADLASDRARTLRRGAPRKADLVLVRTADGPVVVKDFSRKGLWGKTIGRMQIAREAKAYAWLGAMDGVTRFLGRIDPYALVLREVEGRQLAFARDLHSDGPAILARLRALIDRLHERGLAHLDLRGRENVLVRPDGTLVILDLAGAVRLRPGSLAHRLFFPWLARADESAFLKWKLLLDPSGLTAEESTFLRRFRRVRSLWPFNRKPGESVAERGAWRP